MRISAIGPVTFAPFISTYWQPNLDPDPTEIRTIDLELAVKCFRDPNNVGRPTPIAAVQSGRMVMRKPAHDCRVSIAVVSHHKQETAVAVGQGYGSSSGGSMCDRVEQALTCDPQDAARYDAGDGGCFATYLDRPVEGLRQRPLRES